MESVSKTSKELYGRGQNYVRNHPRVAMIAAAVVVWVIAEWIIRRFFPVPPPHVSLGGDPIFANGPDWLTNALLTTFIVDIIVIGIALVVRARMSLVPTGFYNAMEAVIQYLYGLAESVAGKDARKFFPWAATIFFFVIISNWSGMIPGVGSIGFVHEEAHAAEGEHAIMLDRQLAMADGMLLVQEGETQEGAAEEEHHEEFVPFFRAPSADLNTTFALAIATMVMVQIWGVRTQGGNYFRKFWNTSGTGMFKGINIFVSILELISEFARIIAFAFRLFGNIFAGEIVLATMAFLIAFLLPLPFYALEVFVGFVQALVFMMLALGFFTMATISHGHDDHAEAHAEATSTTPAEAHGETQAHVAVH